MNSRSRLLACTLLLALGCKPAPPPARTERQRDSIIGQSKLPGAGGVRGALRAGDTAVAHNTLRDSLAQEP
ncbi:MAG: hypothetical protein ABIZ70_04365 [Gemmatimonadales bacterium]